MPGSRDGVFMFSTSSNLALIAEAPTLYMDGTFQICTCLFYQVFMTHASKHRWQFPLVYFLLPSKSQEAYNTAFILLKEAVQNIGIEANLPRVLTDFDWLIPLLDEMGLDEMGINTVQYCIQSQK